MLTKKNLKHQLSSKIIKVLIKLLKQSPRHLRKSVVGSLAKLILLSSKKTRHRAINNITRALPDLTMNDVKSLAYEAYANCAFGVAESFWLEQIEPEIFCDEDTLEILQSGQGACIATMHLGCYEAVPLAVQKLARSSVTLTNIPSFIDNGVQFYRNAGITAINKKTPTAFTQVLEQICNQSYVSLHCDLYANETPIRFFEQQTKAPAGVALLAAMSKKPLLLGYATYQGDERVQVFFETITLDTCSIASTNSAELAQQLMNKIYQRFEQVIRQYPNQWYWSYNRWR